MPCLTSVPSRRHLLALLTVGALLPRAARAAPDGSPIGRWRTFDDNTGRERGLVTIHEQDGALVGVITDTIDPAEGAHLCDRCDGERRNKPIRGLTILTGARPEGDSWTGGRILDPETGSLYRCTLRLDGGGQKLVLRGYIGISAFGRSQTWLRAP